MIACDILVLYKVLGLAPHKGSVQVMIELPDTNFVHQTKRIRKIEINKSFIYVSFKTKIKIFHSVY